MTGPSPFDGAWKPKQILCAGLPFPAEELADAVTRAGASLTVAGTTIGVLGQLFQLHAEPAADPKIPRAFAAARTRAGATVTDADVDAIGRHVCVVYVESEPLVDDEDALACAQRSLALAVELLDVGALGVKCESSGTVHGADGWRLFLAELRSGLAELRAGSEDGRSRFFAAMIRAWVRWPVPADDDVLTTVGMHLLGRPEVAVARTDVDGDDDATQLLAAFAHYSCAEVAPADLADGHHFRLTDDAPRYVLRREWVSPFPEYDVSFDPWGRWRLVRERDAAGGVVGGPIG
ncbi:MAG: hypothetical protein ABMB14_28995 [Myxococcota bacterium]